MGDADFSVLDGRTELGYRATGVIEAVNSFNILERTTEVRYADLREVRLLDMVDLHLQLGILNGFTERGVARSVVAIWTGEPVVCRNLPDDSGMGSSGLGIVDSSAERKRVTGCAGSPGNFRSELGIAEAEVVSAGELKGEFNSEGSDGGRHCRQK